MPDVVAVMDCDPDLELGSWVVAAQRRGIDLVIEVRNTGARRKDLVENVRDHARLGVPEYFSFDCRSATLRGWRLGAPDARTYQPIVAQGGLLTSRVLGIELAVVDRGLRFFANQALVPSASEPVSRLEAMTDESQRAALESERAAQAADARATKLRGTVAGSIVRLCERQGIALDAGQRARLAVEQDVDRLARCFDRSLDAATAAETFGEPG